MKNEKKFVTLVSLIAAVFLTGGKLVVGLLTGSLGILSEAVHSGLDAIASVVTFFAVRASDVPADSDHAYGHGKIENLSALLEAALLLGACVWIDYEALRRIFLHIHPIEVNALAFGVVIASILIDLWRSTALRRAAKKYKSQALEADALNFTMDLWTSSVVLVGLGLVKLGERMGQAERYQGADAVAALVVTLLLMTVTVQLGKRAVDVLMDRAPSGLKQKVKTVAHAVEGVMSAHQIRVRPSGNRFFIDLHICVARNVGFETSHQIAEAVEAAVRKAVENSDVVVHVDPRPAGDEELSERARVIAANLGVPVHDVHFHKQDDKLHLSLDIEVDASLPLDKAHDVSKRLEQALRAGIPEVHHVHTHIEPHRPEEVKTASLGHDSSRLVEELKKAARTVKGIVDCHEVEIEDAGAKELIVSLHCTFAGGASIEQAHQAASEVERKLRSKYPAIQRVLVHTEPRPHRDPARRSLGEGGVEKKRH